MPNVSLAAQLPVPGNGRAWHVLQFPLTRIVVAAIPLLVVSIVGELAVTALGPSARFSMTYAVVRLVASLAAVAVYAAFVRTVERRRVVELGAAGAARESARGFGVGAALSALTIGLLVAIGVGRVAAGAGLAAFAPALVGACAASIAEELLLRGVIFRIVEERLGSWIALAISAALFGFAHAFNPNATVSSSLAVGIEAGVLLAAAYMVSRRLWLPIGLHAGWNFAQMGVFGAATSGYDGHGVWSSQFTGPAVVSGGGFGPEGSIVAVAVCVAASVVLLALANRRGQVVAPFWKRRQRTWIAL